MSVRTRYPKVIITVDKTTKNQNGGIKFNAHDAFLE
jgi:hypothetical protein